LFQITGGDEQNYPLTRIVQSEIWIHQHPLDCENETVKFLVVDWETLPIYGSGAQITEMTGLLAIAINENRVLVANHYNRADHDGCRGIQCFVLFNMPYSANTLPSMLFSVFVIIFNTPLFQYLFVVLRFLHIN